MKSLLVALVAALALSFLSVSTADAATSYEGIIVHDNTICLNPLDSQPFGSPLSYGRQVMVHPVTIPKWDMTKWTLISTGGDDGGSCLVEASAVMAASAFGVASVVSLPNTGVGNPDEGPEDLVAFVGIGAIVFALLACIGGYLTNKAEIDTAIRRSFQWVVRLTIRAVRWVLMFLYGAYKRGVQPTPYRFMKPPRFHTSEAVDSLRR